MKYLKLNHDYFSIFWVRHCISIVIKMTNSPGSPQVYDHVRYVTGDLASPSRPTPSRSAYPGCPAPSREESSTNSSSPSTMSVGANCVEPEDFPG